MSPIRWQLGSKLVAKCLKLPQSAYLKRSEVAETIDLVNLAFHQ